MNRTSRTVRSDCTTLAQHLYFKLRNLSVGQLLCILFQRWLYLRGDELVHNLRRTSDESGGVEKRVQLWKDGFKERSLLDTLDEIVRLAFLLDDRAGLVRQHTGLKSV